ncbi:hypothetical protein ACVW00_003163 [Marmoricola sp. URHA0025 HA25]
MLGYRLGAAVLTAAVAGTLGGCSSHDGLTIGQAADLGSKRLDALESTLVGHDEPTVAWHAATGTTPKSGCAKGEERWTGVATVTVRARNDDGDSASTEVVGRLAGGGWDPGLQAGDLDDDPATAIPAVRVGKDPAGLVLTVTVERVQGAWHYVVAMTSACASRS